MKKTLLMIFVVIAIAVVVFVLIITRDGILAIPEGKGVVRLDAGEFEAFPLPDYAAKQVTDDYKSYFVEVEPGIKVHVLEVGSGFPVFLQHGNPTSGFLYRKVAAELPTDRLRLIMPTLVGLGFSTKIPSSRHTLDNHMRWINSVLLQLKLKELVYIGQDWGGAIGVGALALSPDLLKGAVILNTAIKAPTEKVDVSAAHAMVKTPVVGELVLEVFTTIFEQFDTLQGDSDSIPAEIADLYGRPVLESGNSKAPVTLMRMVPDGPDHPSTPAMRTIEQYFLGLDIPVEIVWGMKDPIFGKLLWLMKEQFPKASVTETGGGHFLQEQVPAEIAAALLRVVEQVQTSKNR
jgi:pimeloyl-ACP methyl ester carboxylesterase